MNKVNHINNKKKDILMRTWTLIGILLLVATVVQAQYNTLGINRNESLTQKTFNELGINSPVTNITYNNNTYIGGTINNWLGNSKTCSGTDKFSAYDNSTGNFTCSTDETGITSETDPLAYNGTLAYNSSLANYYLKSNPSNYWNNTWSGFNKTYADTLYSTIDEPKWSGNYSSVAFKNTAVPLTSITTETTNTIKATVVEPWFNFYAVGTTYYVGRFTPENLELQFLPIMGFPLRLGNSSMGYFYNLNNDNDIHHGSGGKTVISGTTQYANFTESGITYGKNLNMTGYNITGVNCYILQSGGSYCST